MGSDDRLIFTVVIAGRKQQDAILKAMQDLGIHMINSRYGHGTANVGVLGNVLGFIPEHRKVVIAALSKQNKSQALLKVLREDFHFDVPNTGMAFTVAVEKLSF